MKNILARSTPIHYLVISVFVFNSEWSRHEGKVIRDPQECQYDT